MSETFIPKFYGFLKERGLKWTPERKKVFEEAFRIQGHFEAEDLAYRLRKKGSRVSKATVYRTLPILVKAGLIKEAIHGEKRLCYECVREGERHDHLICIKCGEIVEFKNSSLRKIEEEICKENQFEPQKVLIEIFGYCKKCQ
ncbi:MAG: transcriptional repressor [Desulfobacteraceae bacterium]|nr:MAG: transcriptional repressor [Desulfobacteraceae bacterium]